MDRVPDKRRTCRRKANRAHDFISKTLNEALLAVQPTAAVEVKPMNQAMGFALLPSRAGAGLLGVIGALALTLASIGLYGVLSYSVSRRIREIALRVALGAQRGEVLRLVLREGAWILGVGVAIGLFVSIFVTKPVALFLAPGLKLSDPLTYVRPAFRALQADPLVALRYESNRPHFCTGRLAFRSCRLRRSRRSRRISQLQTNGLCCSADRSAPSRSILARRRASGALLV
jgi:FtsX-like permease family